MYLLSGRLKMRQYTENHNFSLISHNVSPLSDPGSDTVGFWMAAKKQRLIFFLMVGVFLSLLICCYQFIHLLIHLLFTYATNIHQVPPV